MEVTLAKARLQEGRGLLKALIDNHKRYYQKGHKATGPRKWSKRCKRKTEAAFQGDKSCLKKIPGQYSSVTAQKKKKTPR